MANKQKSKKKGSSSSSSSSSSAGSRSNNNGSGGKNNNGNEKKINDNDNMSKVGNVLLNSRTLLVAFFAMIFVYHRHTNYYSNSNHNNGVGKEVGKGDESTKTSPIIDLPCDYVMAPSQSNDGDNIGWGVYVLKDISLKSVAKVVVDDPLHGTRQSFQQLPRILYEDMLIPVPDLRQYQHSGISNLLLNYSWTSQRDYTKLEGTVVMTVSPGMGMLCNAGSSSAYNAIPNAPQPPLIPNKGNKGNNDDNDDEGGGEDNNSDGDNNVGVIVNGNNIVTSRSNSYSHKNNNNYDRRGQPGVGASTLFHGKQFYARIDDANAKNGGGGFDSQDIVIKAGSEILVDYGPTYSQGKTWDVNNNDNESNNHNQQDVERLVNNGMCLDHIKPGYSEIAGQGAIATRDLDEGVTIAPLPVLATNRTSLDMTHAGMQSQETKYQLLLNYCYGHPNSSLLLYPYSPVSNYINHANTAEQGEGDTRTDDNNKPTKPKANAVIRWSSKTATPSQSLDAAFEMEPHDILNSRYPLLLELVALRDIEAGEEILIDYQNEWQNAWKEHAENFPNDDNNENYMYASEMNQMADSNHQDYLYLKTYQEQLHDPYPSNIETSCYYEHGSSEIKVADTEAGNVENGMTMTTSEWRVPGMTMKREQGQQSPMPPPPQSNYQKPIYERFLRPCHIIDRQLSPLLATTEDSNKDEFVYTVEILNPRQLDFDPTQKVPMGVRHFVVKVPRTAVVFTDKLYTTDQHLTLTFRHEIGLPSDVFPKKWMDL